MPWVKPESAETMVEVLRDASSRGQLIALFGNNSKRLMGGPIPPAELQISTARLRRVLQYEPNDLTISVEAGMPFAELQSLLAANRQMIALDPPFAHQATIGGVIATNSSGPMRRGYGTARDIVIGMKFATLEGKIVSSGGMVVKNVAGLDMGKLMIGSFGTLAAIVSVNFRLHPIPDEWRTFLFSETDAGQAIARRDTILKSVLQPAAVDLISPPTAARFSRRGYMLAVRAGGSSAVLDRYRRELTGSDELRGERDAQFWQQVTEFPQDFLRRQPEGIVARISTTLAEVGKLTSLITDACISRAASGVTYVYLASRTAVPNLRRLAAENSWNFTVEYAPDEVRASQELWTLRPGDAEARAFAMMEKIKQMFDPRNVLNRSRLYGRI